jgi:hypothetical protein
LPLSLNVSQYSIDAKALRVVIERRTVADVRRQRLVKLGFPLDAFIFKLGKPAKMTEK